MITIDLNKSLTDIDGNQIAGSNLAEVLASKLFKGPSEDYLKFVDIAMELNKTKILTADKSDLEKIKQTIKSDRGVGCLLDFAKHQLIKEIERQEKQGQQETESDKEG